MSQQLSTMATSQEQYIQNTMDTTPLNTNDSKTNYKDNSSGKVIKISIIEKKNNRNSQMNINPPNMKRHQQLFQKKKISKADRKDYFGTKICKANKKKVKIVFIDEITDEPLIDVDEIECIKEYNVVPLLNGGKDLYIKEDTCCACFIF